MEYESGSFFHDHLLPLSLFIIIVFTVMTPNTEHDPHNNNLEGFSHSMWFFLQGKRLHRLRQGEVYPHSCIGMISILFTNPINELFEICQNSLTNQPNYQ